MSAIFLFPFLILSCAMTCCLCIPVNDEELFLINREDDNSTFHPK